MFGYRQKIEHIIECDIDTEFFALLLKQGKMSPRTKRYIDKLWEIAKDGYGH